MRLLSLLSFMALNTLVGCAAPEVVPPHPAPNGSPRPLPFPHYVTHAPGPRLSGAAWRAGHRAHALELDGQRCGLTHRGEVQCRPPVSDSTPLPRTMCAPEG